MPDTQSAPRVFVVTGPSGVGKGTLIGRLLERVPDIEHSVSATTRRPRPGEEEGDDYHFMSRAAFEQAVREGRFLEHATYSGNCYGTLRSEVEERLARGTSVVLEIEVQGARQVREALPDAVQVFISPPDFDALRERLERRGTDSPGAIEARLEVAREELDAVGEFPNVVLNDDLDRAAGELESLVRFALGAAAG